MFNSKNLKALTGDECRGSRLAPLAWYVPSAVLMIGNSVDVAGMNSELDGSCFRSEMIFAIIAKCPHIIYLQIDTVYVCIH